LEELKYGFQISANIPLNPQNQRQYLKNVDNKIFFNLLQQMKKTTNFETVIITS